MRRLKMESNYSKEVMKHFIEPQNMGEIKNPDAVGEVGNLKCGDVMRISLRIRDGVIKDAKFKTFGCVAAIASSDVLCDLVKGLKIEDARKIKNEDIFNALKGLPKIKVHCSVLGAEALGKALEGL